MAAAVAAATCAAQDSDVLLPGTRLRVTAPAVSRKPVVGTLIEVDECEIVLAATSSERTPIPRDSITRLQRSVRPSRRTRGALIGFGLGLAAIAAKTVHAGGCDDGCNGGNVLAAVVVALPVAAVGAVVSPGERWVDLDPGHGRRPATTSRAGPRLRLVPQAGRSIGLTVVAEF
jgi:hypothetical protein